MRLWAPWRLKYVRMGKEEGCIFCKYASYPEGKFPVVYKSETSFVVMNEYPYNPGHVMVAPIRHVASISDLSDEEALDLLRSVGYMVEVIDDVAKPDGFNIGMNIGNAAGASVPSHLHVHIVPRWEGDSNFMPVISDTRVISQSLMDSFDEIHRRIAHDKRSQEADKIESFKIK